MPVRVRPIARPKLAGALADFTARLRSLREQGFADPDLVEAFRSRARAAKLRYLSDPAKWLERLDAAVSGRGGVVHFCADAAEARSVILELCRRAGAGSVVKSKSMTCEEIELNPALEAEGITVTETDMGEFIIQLAGEPPFHILGPAMHKTRDEVAELFAERFGCETNSDPSYLTQVARQVLRQRFLQAEVGISGVNAVACDTGTMAVITNEGNGRFCTTLPKTHIAVMGLEKAVPTIEDLALISTLLPRASLGWPISSYVSWVSAAAGADGGAGPREFHLVIIDGGRSEILKGPFWEILLCLRCSSCLNYCPVYGKAGGHHYGWVYPGPMGSVLTPLLRGDAGDDELPHASTLCGRCREKCPVGIDLPGLMLLMRQRRETLPGSLTPRLLAEVLSRRGLFEAACRLAGPLSKAAPAGPPRAWRQGGRELPRVPGGTFIGRGRGDGDG